MNSACNTNQSFKMVINQIKMAVNFSSAGISPYTPEQVATIAYKLILSIGYFIYSC